MKTALSFLVLLSIICLVLADLSQDWLEFKRKYNKNYRSKEDELRKEIYRLTVEEINEHDKLFKAGKVTWQMGVSNICDLTLDEIKQSRGFPVSQYPDQEWLDYKAKFGKNYHPKEDALRQRIFHKNLDVIKKRNQNLGINADLKVADKNTKNKANGNKISILY